MSRFRSIAEDQLRDEPEFVYCPNCEEWTRLMIEDNSFGHAFGTEYRYDVVTKCCGAYEWKDKGPCKFEVELPSKRIACDFPTGDLCECVKDGCDCYEKKGKEDI